VQPPLVQPPLVMYFLKKNAQSVLGLVQVPPQQAQHFAHFALYGEQAFRLESRRAVLAAVYLGLVDRAET